MAITYTQFEKIAAATGLGSVAAQDLKDAYDALIEIDGGTGDLVVASLEVNGVLDASGGAASQVLSTDTDLSAGLYTGAASATSGYAGLFANVTPNTGPYIDVNVAGGARSIGLLGQAGNAVSITIGQATGVDIVAIKGATTITGPAAGTALAVTSPATGGGVAAIVATKNPAAATGDSSAYEGYANGTLDATAAARYNTGFYLEAGATRSAGANDVTNTGLMVVAAGGQVNVALDAGLGGDVKLCSAGAKLGFHGTAPIVKQTGVAVTAEAIHAALVALGLIAA